jgi:hypothetical protein
LEKEDKLNFKNLEIQSMFDPLFYKTTKKFDDLSMGNLLSSSLSIDSQLILKLDSSDFN